MSKINRSILRNYTYFNQFMVKIFGTEAKPYYIFEDPLNRGDDRLCIVLFAVPTILVLGMFY